MPAGSRYVSNATKVVLILIIFICIVQSVDAYVCGGTNEKNLAINFLSSHSDDARATILRQLDEISSKVERIQNSTNALSVNSAVNKPSGKTLQPNNFTPITVSNHSKPFQKKDNFAINSNVRQNISNNIQIYLSKKNIITDVAKEISTKDELKALGIQNYEKLMVPSSKFVRNYDIITVESDLLYKELEAGNSITIAIGGTDYPAELSRMNFENIDDHIESYRGNLTGVKNSDILFTIGEKVLIGRITLENTTYWINPIELRQTIETNQLPLHIVYNSNQVTNKTTKIDNGLAPAPEITSNFSGIGIFGNSPIKESNIEQTPLSQVVTVNILVVTDTEFYNNSYWIPFAQNIVAMANIALGTSDINVHLNPIYDDSRRNIFSTDERKTTYPLQLLYDVYPPPILNSSNADIVLYLGGNDFVNGPDQGSSWGYGSPDFERRRYAWAQMVKDDLFYTGTAQGQAIISIHEIGHLFGACHQNQPECTPYARAHSLDLPSLNDTVMWDSYCEWLSLPLFSSDDQYYHGFALGSETHDNSRKHK